MKFDNVTESNLLLYAAQNYHNPLVASSEDFYEDLKRFKYIKRLVNRYLATNELSERLILNHLIVIFNMFGIEAALNILDLKLEEDNLELKMNVCPSLSKVLDNDAEPMKRYCDHCAGWIGPLIDKVGYHLVYDVIDRSKPQCVVKIFKDKEKAIKEEKNAKLLMGWPGKEL